MFVVAPGEELAFLHPHPVRALWGVGPATHRRLERFGVGTVGDLAALPVETLVGALGPAAGRHLHELAWARDPRAVVPEQVVKSIGHEETFATDQRDPGPLQVEVVRQADAVATRLRKAGVAGRTVTLKVRFPDFRTITRSRTAAAPIDTGAELARLAAGAAGRRRLLAPASACWAWARPTWSSGRRSSSASTTPAPGARRRPATGSRGAAWPRRWTTSGAGSGTRRWGRRRSSGAAA